MTWETVWSFHTKQFHVALEIAPEDIAPDFDDDGETDRMIEDGTCLWFQARVAVYKNNHRIGADHLGGCAYKDAADFYASHRDKDPMNRNCSIMRAARGNLTICHYFPDMVRLAIADARRTLQSA